MLIRRFFVFYQKEDIKHKLEREEDVWVIRVVL
jgi:hypothetical protein